MILEIDFSWIDYARQLSFPYIPHFPGKDSYICLVTFDRSPLGTQCPTLVCVFKEAPGRAQDDWTFLLGLRPKPVWD